MDESLPRARASADRSSARPGPAAAGLQLTTLGQLVSRTAGRAAAPSGSCARTALARPSTALAPQWPTFARLKASQTISPLQLKTGRRLNAGTGAGNCVRC